MQQGVDYYQFLPEVKSTLIDISIWLHYVIFNEKLDRDIVWEKNKLLEDVSYKIVNPDLYISKRRRHDPQNYDISLERKFFQQLKKAIKKRSYNMHIHFLRKMQFHPKAINLETKNNGIIAITLAIRYAIDGNLPSDIAFHSVLYIYKPLKN